MSQDAPVLTTPESPTPQTIAELAREAHVKMAVRDLAVAMVNEGLSFVDFTVGAAPGSTSLSVRVFLKSATLPDGRKIVVGKKRK